MSTYYKTRGRKGGLLSKPRVGPVYFHHKVDLTSHFGIVDALAALVHHASSHSGGFFIIFLSLDHINDFIVPHNSGRKDKLKFVGERNDTQTFIPSGLVHLLGRYKNTAKYTQRLIKTS